MTRFRIEQALVSAFGVLLGLVLAMLIAPGDFGLWVVIAILLALFCRAFFIRGLYGELLWPDFTPSYEKDQSARTARR